VIEIVPLTPVGVGPQMRLGVPASHRMRICQLAAISHSHRGLDGRKPSVALKANMRDVVAAIGSGIHYASFA
jgi:hypothetical protein